MFSFPLKRRRLMLHAVPPARCSLREKAPVAEHSVESVAGKEDFGSERSDEKDSSSPEQTEDSVDYQDQGQADIKVLDSMDELSSDASYDAVEKGGYDSMSDSISKKDNSMTSTVLHYFTSIDGMVGRDDAYVEDMQNVAQVWDQLILLPLRLVHGAGVIYIPLIPLVLVKAWVRPALASLGQCNTYSFVNVFVLDCAQQEEAEKSAEPSTLYRKRPLSHVVLQSAAEGCAHNRLLPPFNEGPVPRGQKKRGVPNGLTSAAGATWKHAAAHCQESPGICCVRTCHHHQGRCACLDDFEGGACKKAHLAAAIYRLGVHATDPARIGLPDPCVAAKVDFGSGLSGALPSRAGILQTCNLYVG
eukprot:scaffold985_cov573-Prasinococcus_capsulatus_cf.AAC.3